MEIQRDALSLERVVLRFPGIPHRLGRRERVRSPVEVISSGSPARADRQADKKGNKADSTVPQMAAGCKYQHKSLSNYN